MLVTPLQQLVLLSIPICICTAITDETKLTFDPTNVIVSEGNNATLTCNISNSEPGVYYIEWNQQTSYVYHPQANCRVSGPLTNTTKYNVTCIDEDVQITIIKVTRKRHGEVWKCQRNMFGKSYKSSSTITVNIPITHVVLKNMPSYTETIENEVTTFVCMTSAGYPEASIRWYKDNTTLTDADVSTSSVLSNKYLKVVKSTLRVQFTRADNSSEIYCAATNTNSEWLESNRTSVLVYFPPDQPIIARGTHEVMGELNVIEGLSVDLVCTAVSYPESKYNWITPNGTLITGQILNISPITRHTGGNYTCNVTHVMQVPFGDTYEAGHTSVSVFVLYPPEKPNITFSEINDDMQYNIIENSLYVVRLDSFTLNCDTDSEPAPTYHWIGHQSILGSNSNKLTMKSIQENMNLTCVATNELNETFGLVSVQSAKSTLNIIVQYPPITLLINVIDTANITKTVHDNGTVYVIEGDTISMTCEARSKPAPYIYHWSVFMNRTGSTIVLTNVTSQHTGIYSCTVENRMVRTFGEDVEGNKTTYIEVELANSPDAPSNFHYVEDLTTDSSITLSWKPGFDGGTLQTFILRYRVINVDESWNTKSIVDTNSSIMNVTLQSLSSGVIYEISITASNAIGVSKESNYIYVRTKGALKDKIVSQHTSDIPIIVGGSVGGAGLLAGIIMGICLCRRRTIKQSDCLVQESETAPDNPVGTIYDEITIWADTKSAASDSSSSLPYAELRMSTIEKVNGNQYENFDNQGTRTEYVNLNLSVIR